MNTHEHQNVELLAYYIYLAEGRPHGRSLRHWLEAEFQYKTHTFGNSTLQDGSNQTEESRLSVLSV